MAVSAAAFNPNVRIFRVMLGDLPVYADATVTGRFRPAITQADPDDCHPEESPEVEVLNLRLCDGRTNLMGLYADEHIAETIDEQIWEQLRTEEHER